MRKSGSDVRLSSAITACQKGERSCKEDEGLGVRGDMMMGTMKPHLKCMTATIMDWIARRFRFEYKCCVSNANTDISEPGSL